MPLSAKHQRFVAEYLANGGNATKAAKAAGYSPRTADRQGSRLLGNAEIKAALATKTEKVLGKLEITAERTLAELAQIAYADPDAEEAPHAEDELDPGPFGGSLKRRRGSSLRYEHKLKGLELLGKHLELFTEKVKNTHSFEDLTDEQLEARYLALAAKRSAP
jgi:phage terminase small subunit